MRAKKSIAVAQSEDQGDELLSIVAIKGFVIVYLPLKELPRTLITVPRKLSLEPSSVCCPYLIAAMAGETVLTVYLGSSMTLTRNLSLILYSHPHSVDALCSLPSGFPGVDTQSTILTGSSDGLVRAVQILPTKLHGVVADHGDWPIERIAIGAGLSQLTFDDHEGTENDRPSTKICPTWDSDDDEDLHPSRWWVGSVGHDEVLRLSDLGKFFHDNRKTGDEGLGLSVSDEDDISFHKNNKKDDDPGEIEGPTCCEPTEKNDVKKRKRHLDQPSTSKKKGKSNAMLVEGPFFDEI